MKKVSLIPLFFLFSSWVMGQSESVVKQQPSNYKLALEYLPKIKRFDVKDSTQLAKKIVTEDSLAQAIATLNRFDQKNYLLWNLTGPYYNDHLTLARTLDRTILMYKRVNFRYGELWLRKELADLHLRQGKLKLAEQELKQLIKEFEKTNFPDLPKYYDLLAGTYINENDLKNALSIAFETLKHVRLASDSLSLPNFYLRLASVYNIMGNPKTLDWMIKIHDHYIAINQPYAFYAHLQEYASISSKSHMNHSQEGLQFITDFYNKYPPRNDVDKSRYYLAASVLNLAKGQKKKADSLYQKHTEIAGNVEKLSLERGMYLFNVRKYTEARRNIIYALNHPAEGYPFLKLSGIYKALYYIDSSQKNYVSAMRFAYRIDVIKDSMFNVAKNRQIEELQLLYETAQKEKDMNLLQAKAKLQQARLSEIETTRNWVLGGSVMLILLLGISYQAYRQKQKSNQLFLQKNDMLERLVKEKEWLIKEVHHRVKNNLHTVICLLESQAAYLESDALMAIENSQHRIYAMSLIHQKLYQSDDIKTIDMAIYLPEFIHYLEDSFSSGQRVHFELEIETLLLGAVQAIPIALIVNEAVTNSIKYAFTEKEWGVIRISLVHLENEAVLVIWDNGIGIDLEVAKCSSDSLGLKLIRGLTEDINGTIRFGNDGGTRITIRFPFNTDIITINPIYTNANSIEN